MLPTAYGWLGPDLAAGEIVSVSPPRGSAAGGDEVVVGVAGVASLEDPQIRMGAAIAITQEVDAQFGAVRGTAPPLAPGFHPLALAVESPPNVLAGAYEAIPALQITSVSPDHGVAWYTYRGI